MKIAVFHNLPSGGAKRALHEWLKRMHDKHNFDLYTYSVTNEDYLDVRPFMKNVFVFGKNMSNSTGYSLFKKIRLLFDLNRLNKKMIDKIDGNNYDLVFVNHCAFIQSPLILRCSKTPTLYFCQEPFRRVYEPRPWKNDSAISLIKDIFLRCTDFGLKRIDAKNARLSSLVLANSNYSRKVINNAYTINAETNYLGVDINNFIPDPNIEKTNQVISVGRLNKIKGHDFIIRSLGQIDKEIRPALKIICDSDNKKYKEFLINLSKEKKVSCDFEQIPGDKMPKVYNSAILTVFAPILEPLGLVPLESMACGVPVVGVAEAGILETIQDGKTGLLSPRDPISFADSIKTLLVDDEKRINMGTAGVDYIRKNWSWEKSTQMLEEKMFKTIAN